MILSSIFNYGSIEDPTTPLGDVMWGGTGPQMESKAGVPISRQAALKLSAFWRGVNLRSDYIGRLPLEIKRATAKGKELDTAHPAFSLLMYQPNSEQNAFTLKKTAESHQIVAGNGYIYIRRKGSGDPLELLNLDPENTWPIRENTRLWYVTRIDMGENRYEWRKMPPEDVIHIKGLGWDGLCGYPFLRVARETLGLGLAANEYASRFFRNNAEPRVVITMPGTMSQDAQEQFVKQWNAMHQGLDQSHRTAIITHGGDVKPFSVSAKDSQLLDQRKFTLIEIANMLGMPPHKVGASDRIAYNSLEQENQAFADDTLEPRMIEWEQELRNKLLTEKQKAGNTHIIRFDRNELVRADLAARAAYLDKAINKWMTIDEGRMSEGLNPLPGLDGDALMIEAQQQTGDAPDAGVEMRDEMEVYGVAVRAGTITPQTADEEYFRKKTGLPPMSEEAKEAWSKDEGARRPITIAPPPGTEKPSPFGGPPAADSGDEPAEEAEGHDNQKEKGKPPKAGEHKFPSKNAHQALLVRTCCRLAKRVAAQAVTKAKTHKAFLEWVDNRGIDSHRPGILDELEGMRPAFAEVGVEFDPLALAGKIVDGAHRDLLSISTSVFAQGLLGAVDEWSKRFTGPAMEKVVSDVFKRELAA